MSVEPRAEELHTCPLCLKAYKRREHLQRHLSSHNADRPYGCTRCDAAFKRADVMRRHMETCDGKRIHHGVISRRRRACDRCVRQKKACDASSPCQTCQKRGVMCQYSDLGCALGASNPGVYTADDSNMVSSMSWRADGATDIAWATESTIRAVCEATNKSVALHDGDAWSTMVHEAVSDLSFLDSHVAGMMSHELLGFMPPIPTNGDNQPTIARQSYQSDTQCQEYSFQFLADFTSRSGLVESFECGTFSQRREVVSFFLDATLENVGSTAMQASLLDTSAILVELDGSGDDKASGSPKLPTLTSSWTSWLHNPMVTKLQQIILRIKEVVVVKPRNSTVTLSWSPALESRCLNFFSIARFGKFLELYWSIWHPNVNFLHRPTFDPMNSPTILLAAMAIIGACVSPDSEDQEDAKMWYNCVEEMVFTDDNLCSDTILAGVDDHPSARSICSTRRKLQALQAACIVCLYQNWEGTDSSKRRIRRYRFGTVVSVVRDIGMSTAIHANYYNVPDHEFNWQEYVAREELIRTFIWIVLIDTAFIIFNNLPPRMVTKEMTMHMASPESCFQASTSEGCLEQIRHWMPDPTAICNITLRDAIETLCTKNLSSESQRRMAALGPLNLFAIVSAFHYMIFQHQNLTVVEGQLTPIRNALCNWKNIWIAYCTRRPSTPLHMDSDNVDAATMWTRIGFIRHCAEYWLLATLLVERISAASSQQHELGGIGTSDDNGEVCHARLVEPVLDKYDQTSMRQVNELITNFGNFRL